MLIDRSIFLFFFQIEDAHVSEGYKTKKLPVPVLPPRLPNTIRMHAASSLSDSEQHRHTRYKFHTEHGDFKQCMQKPWSCSIHAHSDAEANNVEKYKELTKNIQTNKFSTIKQIFTRNVPSDNDRASDLGNSVNKPCGDKTKGFSIPNGSIRYRNLKRNDSIRLSSSKSAEPILSKANTKNHLMHHLSNKNSHNEDVARQSLKKCTINRAESSQSHSTNNCCSNKSSGGHNLFKKVSQNHSHGSRKHSKDNSFELESKKRILKAEHESKITVSSKKKFFEAKSFKFLMKLPGLSHFSSNDKNKNKIKFPEYSNDTLTNSLSFVRTLCITETKAEKTQDKLDGDDSSENTTSLIRVYKATTTILAPTSSLSHQATDGSESSAEQVVQANTDSFKRIPKPPDPRSYKIPTRKCLIVGRNSLQRPRDKPPSIPTDLNICGLSERPNGKDDQDYSIPEHLHEQIISPARSCMDLSQTNSSIITSAFKTSLVPAQHIVK